MPLGFPYIFSRIQRIKQRSQTVSVTEGLFTFLTITLGTVLVCAGLEAVIHFSWVVRLLMLFGILGVVITSGVLYVVRPLIRVPTDEEIALRVEAAIPGLHNALINAVRLSKDRQVVSLSLVEAAMHEIAQSIQNIDFAPAIPTKRCLFFGLSAAALSLVLAGFMVLAPARLKNALLRITQPTADIPALGQVVLKKVEPGDCTLMAGSDLKVRATIERATSVAIDAALFYTAGQGQEKAVPMSPQGENVFEYEIPDVRVDVSYWVRVGGSESKRFKAEAVEPPLVTRIDLQYEYPPYTGLPPSIQEESDGNIEAVKGTTVSLKITVNKKIKEGYVQFDSGEQARLSISVDGLSGTVKFPIQKDGSYRIFVSDEQGYTNRDPAPHNIKAIPDQPPLVKILEPGKDTTVPLDGALKLAVRGSDDFGVASVKLYAKVNAADTPTLVKEWKDFSDPKTASVNYGWPFPAKEYKVGDMVAYYVEVADNCPTPNIVKSQEFKVTLEAAQKVAEELKQKYSDWEQKLDKVLRLQREARQEAGSAMEEK